MTFDLELIEFMYLQQLMGVLIRPAGTSSLTVMRDGHTVTRGSSILTKCTVCLTSGRGEGESICVCVCVCVCWGVSPDQD